MRVARAPTSVRISKVESLASRISPPGTIDCSGSHWRTVPLIETVLTAFRVSAPPIAWTARFTRSWLYDVAGALATTTSDKARSETTRFMGLPPAIWMAATLRIGHPYVKAGKGYAPTKPAGPALVRRGARPYSPAMRRSRLASLSGAGALTALFIVAGSPVPGGSQPLARVPVTPWGWAGTSENGRLCFLRSGGDGALSIGGAGFRLARRRITSRRICRDGLRRALALPATGRDRDDGSDPRRCVVRSSPPSRLGGRACAPSQRTCHWPGPP